MPGTAPTSASWMSSTVLMKCVWPRTKLVASGFSIGTVAMAITMVTAIIGASVDTGVLPPMVHAMIAYGAIVCNLTAAKIEISALSESSRIVDEVNRQIQS